MRLPGPEGLEMGKRHHLPGHATWTRPERAEKNRRDDGGCPYMEWDLPLESGVWPHTSMGRPGTEAV